MPDARCPWCGAAGDEDIDDPEVIECDSYACDAQWTTHGATIRLPRGEQGRLYE